LNYKHPGRVGRGMPKHVVRRKLLMLDYYSTAAPASTRFLSALHYLKDLIGDGRQRPVAAERADLEDVNAPRVDVVEHRTEGRFMGRLHAVHRQPIAGERIRVHQRPLEARNLRHGARRARPLGI
jgi:hypothetical protein